MLVSFDPKEVDQAYPVEVFESVSVTNRDDGSMEIRAITRHKSSNPDPNATSVHPWSSTVILLTPEQAAHVRAAVHADPL